MDRKTLARIAFASVAVPALAFGAPATALADSFFSGEASSAGPEGATSHEVTAIAFDGNDDDNGDWDGGSFYEKSATGAGHDGAASHSIVSGAS